MDTAPTPYLILALLGLLIVTAFSSGTEVAMLSVSRPRIRHRAASGQRRARLLESLLQKPDQWLGANLVILALASVAATTAATLLRPEDSLNGPEVLLCTGEKIFVNF